MVGTGEESGLWCIANGAIWLEEGEIAVKGLVRSEYYQAVPANPRELV